MPDSTGLMRRIRRAGPGDAEAIADLVRRAYARWVPVAGTEPRPLPDDFAEAVADHPVWVLEGQGGIEAVLELLPARDHLLVENVAVDPDSQGRGLGRRLMAFAETEARRQGLAEVRLFTDERFADNVAFYARLGYHVFDRTPNGAARLVFMAKPVDRAVVQR
ncbi:MAG TPA: GNAT family N-acetyltransferase [Azospirillum sp.]|nr:GNAT family N-acetyltransferase [Azospirillum sp.]